MNNTRSILLVDEDGGRTEFTEGYFVYALRPNGVAEIDVAASTQDVIIGSAIINAQVMVDMLKKLGVASRWRRLRIMLFHLRFWFKVFYVEYNKEAKLHE